MWQQFKSIDSNFDTLCILIVFTNESIQLKCNRFSLIFKYFNFSNFSITVSNILYTK